MSGDSILFPSLPYTMPDRAERASKDVQLQQFVNSATRTRDGRRTSVCAEAFGDRYDALRSYAGSIKQHALDHLDWYLEQFADRAAAAGATVHFAADADAANRICVEIARRRSCRLCVKSKSMVTEETHLVPELERIGCTTVETDLGEFIIQLDHDAPAHIVTPMIHKDRHAVARAFVRELAAPYTEDPEQLTRIAREHMRGLYQKADLGISGANFLIAETGSIVICTNEGNADLSTSCPPVHIALVGIEKLLPRMADLPVFLKLLARSGTGQPLTVYTSVLTGPRRGADPDGPEQLHIIFLDNGRTEILKAETRELLRCIRCGACLNVCPVFRKVGGGHAYGAVYSGPIGAAITPLLKGLHNYPDLAHASSLCGACHAACPVNIDIPGQLIRLRREMVARRMDSRTHRLAMHLWTRGLTSRASYNFGAAAARVILRAAAPHKIGGSADPLSDRRWLTRGPGLIGAWTSTRDLPTPTSMSFRTWWKRRQGSQVRRGGGAS